MPWPRTFVDEPRPKERDTFSPDLIPGYEEGAYPLWSKQVIDKIIPPDLLEKYGTREANMMNGAWWDIRLQNWLALKRELEDRGFTLVERADVKHFQ